MCISDFRNGRTISESIYTGLKESVEVELLSVVKTVYSNK